MMLNALVAITILSPTGESLQRHPASAFPQMAALVRRYVTNLDEVMALRTEMNAASGACLVDRTAGFQTPNPGADEALVVSRYIARFSDAEEIIRLVGYLVDVDPGAFLTAEGRCYDESSEELGTGAKKAIRFLIEGERCVNDHGSAGTRACANILANCNSIFGYSRFGIYGDILSGDGTIERVSKEDLQNDALANRHLQALLHACEMAGSKSQSVSPRDVMSVASMSTQILVRHFLVGLSLSDLTDSVPRAHEAIEDRCIREEFMPQREAVTLLLKRFPLGSRYKELESAVASHWQACGNVIEMLCQASTDRYGKMTVSYLTKGCELRTVTVADVEADIERWRRSGLPEAERLVHRSLISLMLMCEAAEKKGYRWRYVQPEAKTCEM